MVKITIPGRPVPKGRPRLGYRGRKAYVYTPQETKDYESIVSFVASAVCRKPMEGDVEAILTLYFNPNAKGITKSGRRQKMTIPDVDNCAKAVLDGLNKVAFKDDRQVAKLIVERRFDLKERAEVVLREVR